MRHDAESRFDGVLKRAMPLILFSYDLQKKALIEKIYHLYSSLTADDSDIFEEVFNQISDMITNREELDSNRERLIMSFTDRTKTYDERLREHAELIRMHGKRLARIDTNRKNIKDLEKSIKEIVLSKNNIKKKTDEKHKEKNEQKVPYAKSTEKTCPRCKYTWNFKGKGTIGKDRIRRFQCPICKKNILMGGEL